MTPAALERAIARLYPEARVTVTHCPHRRADVLVALPWRYTLTRAQRVRAELACSAQVDLMRPPHVICRVSLVPTSLASMAGDVLFGLALSGVVLVGAYLVLAIGAAR